MDVYLNYGPVVLLCIVLVCWVINLFLAYRRGQSSFVLGRCVYILGIVTVLVNTVRVWRLYDNSRGVMIFCNAVVIVCIIIAFVRAERAHSNGDQEDQEDQEEAN